MKNGSDHSRQRQIYLFQNGCYLILESFFDEDGKECLLKGNADGNKDELPLSYFSDTAEEYHRAYSSALSVTFYKRKMMHKIDFDAVIPKDTEYWINVPKRAVASDKLIMPGTKCGYFCDRKPKFPAIEDIVEPFLKTIDVKTSPCGQIVAHDDNSFFSPGDFIDDHYIWLPNESNGRRTVEKKSIVGFIENGVAISYLPCWLGYQYKSSKVVKIMGLMMKKMENQIQRKLLTAHYLKLIKHCFHYIDFLMILIKEKTITIIYHQYMRFAK